MRFALPLAALLALAATSAVQARDGLPRSPAGTTYMTSETGFEQHRFTPHAHHHACIGLAAGTAHHSCGGTHTGGPVGGLH